MPKATMHEHCLLEPNKSEIGPTRKVFSAESKSESEAMSDASYDALGSRIKPSNGGHDFGPVFLGKPIHSRPTWFRSGPSGSQMHHQRIATRPVRFVMRAPAGAVIQRVSGGVLASRFRDDRFGEATMLGG
jgi:hypothetical protein